MSTEDRWRIETPYLADLIARHVAITPETTLIDYGCGIGRMSKELIARHGCRVIGIDISPVDARARGRCMCSRTASCRARPRCSMSWWSNGVRFDAAISIWVLQHCLDPGRGHRAHQAGAEARRRRVHRQQRPSRGADARGRLVGRHARRPIDAERGIHAARQRPAGARQDQRDLSGADVLGELSGSRGRAQYPARSAPRVR